MTRDLDFYRMLPYERVWETRGEGQAAYMIVRLAEIHQVAGDGVTKEEAVGHLREAFDDYITWALGEAVEIPLPSRPVSLDEPAKTVALERLATDESDASGLRVKLEMPNGETVAAPAIERRYEVAQTA